MPSPGTKSTDLEASNTAPHEYFTANDSATLSITGDVTFEAWAKFESTPSSGNRFVIGVKPDADCGNAGEWALELLNDAGILKLRAYTGVSGVNQLITYTWTPTTAVWYHLAYRRTSGDGVQKLFIDGDEVATITNTSGAAADNASGIAIGTFRGCADPAPYKMDGLLDEIRLWAEARTQAQIKSNMCTQITSQTNLNASWTFDDTLNDQSGNSNTLTANHTAVYSTDLPNGTKCAVSSPSTLSLLGVT